MPKYFAEINENKIVERVVVCSDPNWLHERLGGTWVETADPYSDEEQEVVYCGPGFGCDEEWPERFAPQWIQPQAIPTELLEEGDDPWTWYNKGARVFHNGRIWRSTADQNVWEPGQAGWHDSPIEGLPAWIPPSGSIDTYPQGAEVHHDGQDWVSTIDDNVWEPGVHGWEVIQPEEGEEGEAQEPEEPGIQEWSQPEGGHDAYSFDDVVMHDGLVWISLHDGNVWEPGQFGWELVEEEPEEPEEDLEQPEDPEEDPESPEEPEQEPEEEDPEGPEEPEDPEEEDPEEGGDTEPDPDEDEDPEEGEDLDPEESPEEPEEDPEDDPEEEEPEEAPEEPEEDPEDPEVPEAEPWSQPAGGHDAYQTGDVVSYNGTIWVSTHNDNVWEPGVFGWEAQ